MQIICQNDTNDSSFLADEQTAVNILDSAFPDNITVTIQVGDGDYKGTTLNDQSISEGDVNSKYILSYSQLSNDLLFYGQPGFFNSTNLPSGSSVQGISNFWVSSAEAKIFGIQTNGAVDGFVGIGTGFSAGAVRVSAFLHEICHALGRTPENYIQGGTTYYSALDLWRFTSTAGNRLFDPTNPDHTTSWFSLDDGAHYVAYWGENSDSSDFKDGTAVVDSDPNNDPFDENVGTVAQLEAADFDIMEALGFSTIIPAFTLPMFVLANYGAGSSAGNWSSDNTYPRLMADVNGDGLADIVGFGSGGVWVSFAHRWRELYESRVGYPEFWFVFLGRGVEQRR
jgi:hypothetical protein